MPEYTLTVFEKNGEPVLDEKFEAKDEKEAKEIGARKLREAGREHSTGRVTSSAGKLVLFNR